VCKVVKAVASLVVAVVLFVVMAVQAHAMTLTFVRHAQSEANAAGVISSTVPGPGLTPLGVEQAQAIAAALAGGNFDGIYASTMVRTQLTAAPLAGALGQEVHVLPGLREVGAGIFEGAADRGPVGLIGYGGPGLAWILGARFVPVLGAGDGNEFDARVDGAIRSIYDSGVRNPVLFSHGGTIMYWVMMNVDNPDPLLILTHPLNNTAVVTVDGSPETGWTLRSWDGMAIDPNPSLLTRAFVFLRNLITLPQTIVHNLIHGLPAPAPAGVATASAPSDVPAASTDYAAESKPARIAPRVAAVADAKPDTTDDAAADLVTDPTPVAKAKPATTGRTDLSTGNKVRPGRAPAVKPNRGGSAPARSGAPGTAPTASTPDSSDSPDSKDAAPAAA
jgi:broad specificity phosphatase PhoE